MSVNSQPLIGFTPTPLAWRANSNAPHRFASVRASAG